MFVRLFLLIWRTFLYLFSFRKLLTKYRALWYNSYYEEIISDITEDTMKDYSKTYCNPIPIPDYPIGRTCYYSEVREDFRELADPSVIYEDGKWYLYPSCGMAWWSEDFIHWNHVRVEPYDFGYAPTVVKHKDKFYMTACFAELMVSDTPLGPFRGLGKFTLPDGSYCDGIADPMIFSDTDERLYMYWGCGVEIRGAQLDSDNPTQLITEPKILIKYNPDHLWERIGDWNEDGNYSWTEGSWMYKRGDTYYLTYSGPGTEWRTYAMGAYKSKNPLDGFKYMESSPFMHQKYGLVKGPGHGCIVDGPNGTTWAFFTCLVGFASGFERRIGMDPVGFDENGDFYIKEATETPQWAPGVIENPHLGNDTGLIPLTSHRRVTATSHAPGRDPIYGIDDSMLTWWQPADDDIAPSLTVKYADEGGLNINAVRIVWRDVGLDIKKKIMPGAFRYTIDALTMDGEWVKVDDHSDNTTDLLIDYFTLPEMRTEAIRLNITGTPDGIKAGVINFAVFGTWTPKE